MVADRQRVGIGRIPPNTIIGNINGSTGRGEPPFPLSPAEVATIASLGNINGAVNAQTYYLPTDAGFDSAINQAIAAVNTQGGGTVIVPNLGSVFNLSAKIVLKSNVRLFGYGRPTLKLLAGVNDSMIEGLNYLTLHGTLTNSGTCDNYSVENFILDGNVSNNQGAGANGGHGLAVYGRDFYVRDLYVKNTYRRGVSLEYTNGSNGISPFNGRIDGITTSVTGTEGLVTDVSDCHIDNLNIRSASQLTDNTYDALSILSAAHVGGRVNIWRGGTESNSHRYGLYVDAAADTTRVAGAVIETGKTANLYIGGDNCQITARSYNCLGTYHAIVDGHSNNLDLSFFTGSLPGTAVLGLKLGDDIASRSNIIKVVGSGTANGLVDFFNSGGMNHVEGGIQFGGTDTLWANTPAPLDEVSLIANASTVTDRRSMWKLPMDPNNMVAFGTNSTNATAIRHAVTKVTTNDATGNNGVKLPNPIGGQVHIITNNNANNAVALNVYPHSSGKFVGLATNQGIQIPLSNTFIFINMGFDWGVVKSA